MFFNNQRNNFLKVRHWPQLHHPQLYDRRSLGTVLRKIRLTLNWRPLNMEIVSKRRLYYINIIFGMVQWACMEEDPNFQQVLILQPSSASKKAHSLLNCFCDTHLLRSVFKLCQLGRLDKLCFLCGRTNLNNLIHLLWGSILISSYLKVWMTNTLWKGETEQVHKAVCNVFVSTQNTTHHSVWVTITLINICLTK